MRHTTNQIPPIKPLHTQNGVALIVSLIILLILSILGVQSLQTSTLEEKMAGNFRDNKVAEALTRRASPMTERTPEVRLTSA